MKRKFKLLCFVALSVVVLSFLCMTVSAAENGIVLGDINGDSVVNIGDAIYLLKHTMLPSRYPVSQPADVNGTGDVNIDDAIYLLKHTMLPERYPLLNVSVEEIVIDSSFVYVDAGESASVGITLLPENAIFLSLNYTSSNESVATVSNGVITAISDGIAVITVSVDGLISKSFTVVVENSLGIEYEENETGYTVFEIKNPQETVVIPYTYKGKAVNEINASAFGTECSVIKYLYINRLTALPNAALTNCTQLKKLVLYGGGLIWPPSSDPYDFYRFFKSIQITFTFAPGDLRPGCGYYSHSWPYCDGTCSWYVADQEWMGWVYNSTDGDWYYPCNMDYGAYFKRGAIIDWQNYNGYSVPKNIRMRVYKVPKSLGLFYDGYITIEPESSNVCDVSVVDDLKIKFNGKLIEVPLVSVVSHEDREKLHTIGTHDVTVYFSGFSETVSVTVGHVTRNVEENRIEATCTEDGSYDSVIYCSECNEELSRETVTITALGHQPSDAIIENQVGIMGPCCGGNYDLVVYCSSCHGELSRTNKFIEKTGIHTMSDGVCTYCNTPESSAGLEYSLNEDGKTYTVTDMGTFSGTNLVIGVYNNLSVTSIGKQAFKYYNITSVTIADSVTSIGDHAFYDCRYLKSVTIGKGVISIPSTAFYSCKSLTNLIVDEDNKYYKSIDGTIYTKDGKILIVYAGGQSQTKFTIPAGVTKIARGAFNNSVSLTSITIPNSVTSIDSFAFQGCDNLKSITIPNSVTSISDSLFANCESLTSITIPNSVTSIGDEVFWYCWSLRSIVIPDSVTSIGEDVFQACFDIESIQFSGTKAQWESIKKGKLWAHSSTSYITVYCKDGIVRQTKE